MEKSKVAIHLCVFARDRTSVLKQIGWGCSAHFTEVRLAEHADAELARFLQFAPGLLARQHVGGFLADGAGDFAPLGENLLGKDLARLA